MKRAVLPDTDVLVDFLRGYAAAVQAVKAWSDQIILSSIVVAELYAGARGVEELDVLDHFVSLFRVVPVSTELARAGGLYRQQFHASHGVGLADGIVAATVEREHAELKTLNVRHYPMFKDLAAPYSK